MRSAEQTKPQDQHWRMPQATQNATTDRRGFLQFMLAGAVTVAIAGVEGCRSSAPERAKIDSLKGISQQPVGSRDLLIQVEADIWKPELIKSQQRLDERNPKNAHWVITLERASKNDGSSQQSPQLVEAELTRPRQDTLLFMFVDKEMKKPVNNARAESKFK